MASRRTMLGLAVAVAIGGLAGAATGNDSPPPSYGVAPAAEATGDPHAGTGVDYSIDDIPDAVPPTPAYGLGGDAGPPIDAEARPFRSVDTVEK